MAPSFGKWPESDIFPPAIFLDWTINYYTFSSWAPDTVSYFILLTAFMTTVLCKLVVVKYECNKITRATCSEFLYYIFINVVSKVYIFFFFNSTSCKRSWIKGYYYYHYNTLFPSHNISPGLRNTPSSHDRWELTWTEWLITGWKPSCGRICMLDNSRCLLSMKALSLLFIFLAINNYHLVFHARTFCYNRIICNFYLNTIISENNLDVSKLYNVWRNSPTMLFPLLIVFQISFVCVLDHINTNYFISLTGQNGATFKLHFKI